LLGAQRDTLTDDEIARLSAVLDKAKKARR
jgi:hypothetical protein